MSLLGFRHDKSMIPGVRALGGYRRRAEATTASRNEQQSTHLVFSCPRTGLDETALRRPCVNNLI
jgi:hypothetical protein